MSLNSEGNQQKKLPNTEPEDNDPKISVKEVAGEVLVIKNDGKIKLLTKESEINQGDQIYTKQSATVTLVDADGIEFNVPASKQVFIDDCAFQNFPIFTPLEDPNIINKVTVGQVLALDGKVIAIDEEGNTRELSPGDAIFFK